jgi:ClpP class serine protease
VSSLLSLVCSTTWAIRPETLEAIVGLVLREDLDRHDVAAACHWSEDRQREAARAYETRIPIRAVGAVEAQHVKDSFNLYRRGTTAVLPITGAITRYSSLFQALSGQGSSVDTMAKDLNTALKDPNFSSILLSIDSPGGEVNGINELADMIYAGRAVKPIWAFVSDLGASAAYWLASAAERIVVAETAALGSIGAMAVFHDPEASTKDMTFVSSVSPNKKMDPTTKEGARQIQALVNTIGQIFVDKVARNRGVTSSLVTADFGQGGILLGADAVKALMAEEVGTFEGCLSALAELTADAKPPAKLAPAAVISFAELVASLEPTAQVAMAANSISEILAQVNHNSIEDQLLATVTAGMPIEARTLILTSEPKPAQSMDIVPPLGDPESPTIVPEVAMSEPQTTPTAIPIDTAQAELAALRSENQRLRLAAYRAQGEQFADARVNEMKAFPGEREHLVALFVQASLDDEHLGPGMDGTLRTQSLANAIAARTSVSFLTAEALAPTAMQAIHQRVTSAAKDPDAPMTQEEESRLLGFSPLGKSLIPNGRASK